MECPNCGYARTIEQRTCDNCGLVFSRHEWRLGHQSNRPRRWAERAGGLRSRLAETWQGLRVPPAKARDNWWAYCVLWTALVIWGGNYMVADISSLGLDRGFLHNVNLPFHEAGHIVFGVFGDFIGSLGGTLGQLLIPIVCGIALLRHGHDTFGASLCLWWLGQNLLDIAPYMADARAGQLPLLGGNFGHSSPYGFHDWEFILGETGLLAYDRTFAALTLNFGRGIMLAAMAWGAYLLWRARSECS